MTKPARRQALPSLFAAVLFASAVFAAPVFAEEGLDLPHAGTDLTDRASLQRGAGLFMNYCSGCHSLQYLRYSRMGEDLGLTTDEVQNNLNFTGAKVGEHMQVAMTKDAGEQFFGKAPPDLSVIARVRGSDWIYNYLKSFYVDESRPVGWNNTIFPNASMPNPLWQLQGVQHAQLGKPDASGDRPVEKLLLPEPGEQSAEQFDQTARDIAAFLEYAGEPAAIQRQSMGVWVILFLAFFTFLAWLLKKEYWKDVH
jgi:ubiquinol-cytochrome c reductase cytochrome c1 subunit